MYIIAVYDVHHKRVGKVRKVFKKYLFAVQNSVFEGYITESKLNKLKKDLDKIIDDLKICKQEMKAAKTLEILLLQEARMRELYYSSYY